MGGVEGFGAATSPAGIAGALEVGTVGSASWSGLGVACIVCVCFDDPHPIVLSIPSTTVHYSLARGGSSVSVVSERKKKEKRIFTHHTRKHLVYLPRL